MYQSVHDYTPHLFIGIGEHGHFFTLRETYLHAVPGPGDYGNAVVNGEYQGTFEVRSFHHFNLSQNSDEAFEKATNSAAVLGLRLNTTRESLAEELEEIKRATAEELEARKQREREWQEQRKLEREEREAAMRAAIMKGLFPFGDFANKPFAEAPRGYLTWLVDTSDDFEEGSLMLLLAEQVSLQVPELLLPKPDPDAYVGEPKKRMEFSVIVIRRTSFIRESYYGDAETCYVTTMIDKATNACLLAMTPAWSAEEGSELRIKATVKEHSEYQGQAQTKVQRIVEVKAK